VHASPVDWIRSRLTALLDNLLAAGVIALIVAVGASVVAFGGERTAVPVWTLVLLAAVQIGCVVAITLLYRRQGDDDGSAAVGPPPSQPQPHAKLLRRLKALDDSLGDEDPIIPATVEIAEIYNGIRTEALAVVEDSALDAIPEVTWDPLHDYSTGTSNNMIRTFLAQIKAGIT
jgi:hypothetical protein